MLNFGGVLLSLKLINDVRVQVCDYMKPDREGQEKGTHTPNTPQYIVKFSRLERCSIFISETGSNSGDRKLPKGISVVSLKRKRGGMVARTTIHPTKKIVVLVGG